MEKLIRLSILLTLIATVSFAQTRLIRAFEVVTDYDNAGEATLATSLSGQPAYSVVIYNTTLSKARYWNGTAFVDEPQISPTSLPVVNTSSNGLMPMTGTPVGKFLKDDLTWTAITGGGDMLKANNLSDLANAGTARTNLGLGTLATQSGTFSGTSSGTNTGDQTTVSGNAGTATTLQTARNINGVSFNGSADIVTENLITLTSAYTLTSQTAAQKLFNSTTNGAITLTANRTYYFECYFSLTSLSSTSGSFGFALGGTASITRQAWWTLAAKTALATASTGQITYNTAANTTIVTANTTTTGSCRIWGKIVVGTGGTLIPSISMGVASAAIVGNDSYFKIVDVGSNTVQSVGNWN